MRCYICNVESKRMNDFKLYDGRQVVICPSCKLQLSKDNTKNMANIEIPNETSGIPFLGKKTYQNENIRHVKIATEAHMVETEYDGKSTGNKPECEVDTDSKGAPKCIWQMNKKTQKYMVEKFGTDSKNWIGKEFDIKLASAGNQNPSIYPKDLSLEEVIN